MLQTLDRFMRKVDVTAGCWLWTGSKSPRGYGHFYLNGKNERANRASWILHRGEIPPDKMVCHSCDVTACVNPDHLWLGTASDNQLDSYAKGRGVAKQVKATQTRAAQMRAKTHCTHGHPRTPENIIKRSDGRWECGPCKTARNLGREKYHRARRARA